MPEGTPSRLGRYELGEVIGQGAMGVVYKAYDSFLDRIVAVKTYRQDVPFLQQARERFEREVRTASKLSHPNIVIVYDGGLEEGVPYLAMEYIDGPTLRDELARRGRVSQEEALAIVFGICEGLAYAHARNVIHRDLKPGNVLLAPDGIAKISDFGVAKLLGTEAAATNTLTVGTPGYMAPEQIQGKAIGPATDVFALGILAYELLTGVRPFTSETAITLIYQILNTQPKPATELDPSLPKAADGVLARAIEKNPDQRTPDATTFAAELRRAFSLTTPPPPPPPAEASRIRPAWFLVPLALLAAGAGTALLIEHYVSDDNVVALAERTPSAPATTKAPTPEEAPSPVPPSPAPRVEATTIEAPVVAPAAPLPEAPASLPKEEPTAMPTEAPAVVPSKAAPRVPTATQRPATVRSRPTARPTTARARESSIDVASNPAGAEVRVDGTYKGVTPLRITGLAAGNVWLELRKKDYAPYEKSLRLDGSSNYSVRSTLSAALRGTAFMNVISEPAGAKISLNGNPAGSAPLKLGPLEPGRYEVSAEFPGFPREKQVVDMKVGEQHRIKFIFRSGR